MITLKTILKDWLDNEMNEFNLVFRYISVPGDRSEWYIDYKSNTIAHIYDNNITVLIISINEPEPIHADDPEFFKKVKLALLKVIRQYDGIIKSFKNHTLKVKW